MFRSVGKRPKNNTGQASGLQALQGLKAVLPKGLSVAPHPCSEPPHCIEEGVLRWVPQELLWFGRDAKPPRDRRTVLLLAQRTGPWIPVLPTTTGGGPPSSFHRVPGSHFIPCGRSKIALEDNYIYAHAEKVRPDDVLHCLARLDPAALSQVKGWFERGHGNV